MQVFPGATPANRVKLLQGPFQYQFAYARKTARGLVWSKTWLDPVRLPDFFRLEVVNARNSVPIAPSFVVAVPASAEIGCVSESPKLCSATSQGELKRDENNKTPPPEPDKS
jgi:general secretion pathway protein J